MSEDQKPGGLTHTRETLLNRLKNLDDKESWREFFNIYWKLIYMVATKSGLSDSDAQDVVQETLLEASKKLPDFKYDRTKGSFKGWLKQTTRWKIGEHLRKEIRPQKFLGKRISSSEVPNADGEGQTSTVERIADSDTVDADGIWDHEWKLGLQDLALDRLKKRIKPEHYRIYWLRAVKCQPIKTVAQSLGVSQVQVRLVTHRTTKLLKKEIQQLSEQYE